MKEEEQDIDFTIAMTLKNAEATLHEVLKGLENIAYDKVRLKFVFVDGGSKDSSLSILQEFVSMHKEMKTLLIKGNYDILEGRNLCIKHAEGRYLVFVDADVVVPSDILNSLVEIFRGEKVAFVNVPCVVDKQSQSWGMLDTLFDIRHEPMGMSCAAFRLSALKDVGAFFTGIPKGENPSELSARLKRKGYSAVAAPFSARHLKSKSRSFWGYAKTSFLNMPFLHIQAIKSGDIKIIARYCYYSAVDLSLLLFWIVDWRITAALILIGVLYHLYKTRGDPRGLLFMATGLTIPIGIIRAFIVLAVRKLTKKR